MAKDTYVSPEALAAIAELRQRYVTTSRDSIFKQHLDKLLERDAGGQLLAKPRTFTATGDTHGIALVEGAGGGKTSLVHHALSTHPALKSTDPVKRPWVGVRVPSPATLKSLGLEILRATGYPDINPKRREWDTWRLVHNRLKLLGTVVLWIDEAHDLFRAGKAIEDILKMLKSLMQGEGAVIIVLTGVDRLWQMASYDDQVKRRYSKVTLPEISASTHAGMFAAIIKESSAMAGLEAHVGSDLIDRLLYASRNRFGRCIENIFEALECAVLNGDSVVSTCHFAQSWGMNAYSGVSAHSFRQHAPTYSGVSAHL